MKIVISSENSGARSYNSEIRNTKPKIKNNPQSEIKNNPQSAIRNPKSEIRNQKQSAIKNNPQSKIKNQKRSTIQNPQSKIKNNPQSKIQNQKQSTIQNPKSPPGFSLVEVMIAVLILAIGLLSAAQLLTMALKLDALARSKSTATLAAQNQLERLVDLYKRNPAAAELTIGVHQAAELTEIRNPITQKVSNRYKITWLVGEINDPRPEMDPRGRVVSVRATPMLAENVENTDFSNNKVVTINAVITTEP